MVSEVLQAKFRLQKGAEWVQQVQVGSQDVESMARYGRTEEEEKPRKGRVITVITQ